MSGLIWLVVPLAPLLFAALLLVARDRIAPWLWLSCMPALAVAIYSDIEPLANLDIVAVWPGAQWGAPDMLSRALLGFTSLLWAAAGIYAQASQKHHPNRLRFHGFWLMALSGNLLLIIAQDGTSFYVGFTLMSLSAYGLVVHLGGPRPRQAGRLYLQLAVLGEMLLYAGLMLRIYEAGGTTSFAHWQHQPIGALTAVLLLVGFGLKAGFWPLHVWLPLAHPAAPAAASAVLSGAMLKAGFLGIWQFLPQTDLLLQHWAPIVVAVGMFSAFYGVALGVVQNHAKAALAYSSVSQMGYLLVIIALAWWHPQARDAWAMVFALYAVHHGFAKGALFMGAGLAARYRFQRHHWLLLSLPAFALAGLPFTSGAAVKTLLKKEASATDFEPWMVLLSLGALATALIVARAILLMKRAQRDLDSTCKPIPKGMLLPWTLLCVMPILLPWGWTPLRDALLASLSLYAIWALVWPLIWAAALFALIILSGWRKPALLVDLPNSARWAAHHLYRRLAAVNKPIEIAQQPRLKWRVWERQWNRFWQQNIFVLSGWLLFALLLLAW